MLAAAPAVADEAIDHIVSDIKGLGQRFGWDAATTETLRERLLASHDEDVKRFVSALERHRSLQPLGEAVIGIGELVLGAFLTVAGLILVVPAVLGFSSRDAVAQYLAELSMGLASPTLSDPVILALGFGFALFLILTALYTLRQAARSLRSSGLVRAPG